MLLVPPLHVFRRHHTGEMLAPTPQTQREDTLALRIADPDLSLRGVVISCADMLMAQNLYCVLLWHV
jgi:hypothetical protein